MIWLKRLALSLVIAAGSVAHAKNICVAIDFYDAEWTKAFYQNLSTIDADYLPSARPTRSDLEVRHGSAALSECLGKPAQKVIYISHALKISEVAFLVSLDKNAQPSSVSKQTLANLKVAPSVNEITILSCYYGDLLKMYENFQFWRERGIAVNGIETPSLLDAEGRGYVSVFQAASKVAESVWTERYHQPAPFANLELIR